MPKSAHYKHDEYISRGYGRDTSGFKWVESDSFVKDVGDEPLHGTSIYYTTSAPKHTDSQTQLYSTSFEVRLH